MYVRSDQGNNVRGGNIGRAELQVLRNSDAQLYKVLDPPESCIERRSHSIPVVERHT